jgi:Uma2 family endonuclease
MAETTTRLMTVEEFRALPEDTGEFYHELHCGEVVQMPRAKHKHYRIQYRLHDMLRLAARDAGFVGVEFAFRAIPEYDLRVADVAFVSMERYQTIDPEDNLRGAPDMVIEVLSSSNTASEILAKETLCLKNGCREFWVVDPKTRQVKVSTSDGHTRTYEEGQEIPLTLFSDKTLAVSSIFAE